MRRLFPYAFVPLVQLLLALGTSAAWASATFSVVESGSGAAGVNVGPGEGFSIDVRVTGLNAEPGVQANLDSFTYRLVFSDTSHIHEFSRFAEPFDDTGAPAGFNGSIPLGGTRFPITNGVDLGSPFDTPLVPDLYRTTATVAGIPATGPEVIVERLKLAAPTALGDYVIQVQVLEAADVTGAFHKPASGRAFIVRVPEPHSLLQLLAGIGLLAHLVRRRSPGRRRRVGSLRRHTLGLCVALAAALLTGTAHAGPFVPLEWQQEILDVGPLLGERKHLNWSQDLDGDFVDDRFADVDPGEKQLTIVQLSQCQEPSEVIATLGAYGNVKRVGTLTNWVVLDEVDPARLKDLALEPNVAAVEFPQPMEGFLDTSTRTTRTRASVTFSPNTFEDAFGFDGSGIDIAIMDSGVDDAVHNGLPANVSGYDALTATAGDPDDDVVCAGSGADGIVDTTASGGDVQRFPVGNGALPGPAGFFFICNQPGPNGVRDTVLQGDDNSSAGGATLTGNNGICESPALVDDVTVIPVGQGSPNQCGVRVGNNAVIDSALGNDDALVTTFHGTHVAGIALGRGIGPGCSPADDGSMPNDCQGMAPGASLVDVKVLDDLNAGSYADALDAIEWVWTDGRAEIVNMSFGDNSNSDGTSAMSQSINALVSNGIAVAISAGNSGQNALGQTASASLAVTVANADDQDTVSRNDDQIAASSTFGPRTDFNAANPFIGMLKPDITAPGTAIVSTLGDSAAAYQPLGGTSMASPHVAGAMALLLDMRNDLPPGSMKDLLKRSAFVTPAQAAAGASFPAVDAVYNVNWGFGLLDVFAAGQALMNGVTDMSFPSCVGQHPDYPSVRRCTIGGGAPSWANSVDVTLATDPPVQGDPNTITVALENRTGTLAQNVTVCIEVKELGVGIGEFYTVGCQQVATIAGGGSTNVSIPWTPAFDDHQCIQATIDYGLDTQFNNNTTQRNVSPIPSASPAFGAFRIENPFPEPASIQYTVVTDPDLVSIELLDRLPTQLDPRQCPVTVPVEFFPNPSAPKGKPLPVDIYATAFTETHPRGIELSGVRFNVILVDPGLNRDYAVARHGPREYRIPLGRGPTTDPRDEVQQIRVVFNVPVQPIEPPVDPSDVVVSSQQRVPRYTVSFPDGGDIGTELTILFDEPLEPGLYDFDLRRFVDLDQDPLTGVSSLVLRVLPGDSDDSGEVSEEDVAYVRNRINAPLANSAIAGADPNLTGSITGTDISYVRARIGRAVP